MGDLLLVHRQVDLWIIGSAVDDLGAPDVDEQLRAVRRGELRVFQRGEQGGGNGGRDRGRGASKSWVLAWFCLTVCVEVVPRMPESAERVEPEDWRVGEENATLEGGLGPW